MDIKELVKYIADKRFSNSGYKYKRMSNEYHKLINDLIQPFDKYKHNGRIYPYPRK